MKWFENSVALVAMIAVAGGPLAPLWVAPALAQQEGEATLDNLAGEQPAEVVALEPEAQLGEEELDALVAPVALYPDALLAQVLVAATYPLQVVKAERLLEETEGLSDEEAAQRISEEEWDPSVMVLLSGFPTVIQRMADDLDWTERLGTAMVGQDQDVLAAVQRMRTRAIDTGWLESNEAQVVERSDDAVSIRPADPEVVYVPSYDSSLAYTSAPTAAPYIAPSSNPLANPVVAGAIGFGAALLVQQLFKDDDDEQRGWDNYWQELEADRLARPTVLSATRSRLAPQRRRLCLEPGAGRLFRPEPPSVELRRAGTGRAGARAPGGGRVGEPAGHRGPEPDRPHAPGRAGGTAAAAGGKAEARE